MALCKRAIHLGSKTGLCLTKCSDFFSVFPSSKICSRQVSQDVQSNVKRAYLVDTLALVRGLEGRGFSSEQAEAITYAIVDGLENFVSKAEMHKEHHITSLQSRSDIEKIRSELRYEIDKATAGQRLDFNLEKGRIRDEIVNQNAEITNLTNKLDHKLDRETHALRAQLEANKFHVIKYCIGTLVSISAVSVAVARILL